jgi:hypothetical protein
VFGQISVSTQESCFGVYDYGSIRKDFLDAVLVRVTRPMIMSRTKSATSVTKPAPSRYSQGRPDAIKSGESESDETARGIRRGPLRRR